MPNKEWMDSRLKLLNHPAKSPLSRGRHHKNVCQKMIPIGYMAKLVDPKPDWLKTDQVDEIHSVGTDPIRIRKR